MFGVWSWIQLHLTDWLDSGVFLYVVIEMILTAYTIFGFDIVRYGV